MNRPRGKFNRRGSRIGDLHALSQFSIHHDAELALC